jgi:[NiFe] hydrogenase assembly HybE family chaperone
VNTVEQDWVSALTQIHHEIAITRMAGLPVMHPGLSVQAVGFERRDDGLLGVLLTPWFMSLVWRDLAADAASLPVGQHRERAVGTERFEFIGAWHGGLGAYESCSLISPMFEMADQAQAVSTAEEVLAHLFPAPSTLAVEASSPQRPDRRGFLLGRSASAGRP